MARITAPIRRELPDIQWLERMYNNRMRVPDHGDYFARWAAQSAMVRRSLPCQLDVPYGDGPRQRLDAFAARQAGAPLVVFVHGGYWKALDKSFHSFVAGELHDAGAAVVVPNYALAPQASVPQSTMDVAQAVAWAWRHARALKADRRRLVVVGHSAGGTMAAMMMACAWPLVQAGMPTGAMRRGIGLSGLYDLEPLMRTPSLQEALRLSPAQVQQASPARVPYSGNGRFVAMVGADESGEYLRQNRLIQQAWGRDRVPQAQALPGLNHFSILDALATRGHRLNTLARQLLRTV